MLRELTTGQRGRESTTTAEGKEKTRKESVAIFNFLQIFFYIKRKYFQSPFWLTFEIAIE